MYTKAKLVEVLSPHLQRVLILDSSPGSARILRDAMRQFTLGKIHCVQTTDQAYELARDFNPQLFLIDIGGDASDTLQLVRSIRRSYLQCRHAPILVSTSRATADVIYASRDAGVHEFIVRPFKASDLSNRLLAVTLKTRDWIEGMRYVGPDRRRFNSGSFAGKKKRLDDAGLSNASRLQQSLKIVELAIALKDYDPSQAVRAMRVQSEILLDLGITFNDPRMVKEAQTFLRYVTCMTEFDLAKTEALLDVSFPLLSRIDEQSEDLVEFDPVTGRDELVRLKQWKSHVPSSTPKTMPF